MTRLNNTDIADLSREVESTQMNIKQKRIKQNCVILGFTYSFTLLSGFLCDFQGNVRGISYGRKNAKNKPTRNSIKNKEKKLQKVLGKLNGTRPSRPTFSDLFTCLI
jgi:hypothetical protein